MRRTWTKEETDRLRQLRAEGKDINECAAILGRSWSSISHKLYDKKEHFVTAKEKGRKLNETELQWFIAHFRNTPNAVIQRRFGISFSYLHRLARKHGLKKTPQFIRKTQQAAADAAKASHIANGTFPPKGYIIPNGREHYFKKGENGVSRWGKAKERKRIEKSVAALKARYKRERLLVSCGLPQLTKLKIKRQGRSKLNYRYNLRKAGYIQDANDKDLFYLPTDGTPRRLKMEQNGKIHGIRFRSKDADPTKMRSDDLVFKSISEMFQGTVVEPKGKSARPVDTPHSHPLSSRIVRDLSAYSTTNTYLYDE